jgi:hypothetical protein
MKEHTGLTRKVGFGAILIDLIMNLVVNYPNHRKREIE